MVKTVRACSCVLPIKGKILGRSMFPLLKGHQQGRGEEKEARMAHIQKPATDPKPESRPAQALPSSCSDGGSVSTKDESRQKLVSQKVWCQGITQESAV